MKQAVKGQRIMSFRNKYLALITMLLFSTALSFAQTIDNKPRVFNVKMFGASGDSTQNATPFIQAAINACWTAGGGIVYFPNGQYWLSGALITAESQDASVNPNSQLYVPASVVGANRCHIIFRGETPPPFPPGGLYSDTLYTRKGVIIKSTITGSGTIPAIFGGPGVSGTFNYNVVSFENLNLIVKAVSGTTGPTMSGINGLLYSSILVNNCQVGLDTSFSKDTIPSLEVAGIITSKKGGETMSSIRNTVVWGFRYGIVAGEHLLLDNAQVQGCFYGFVIQPNALPVYASKIEAHWNKYDIYVPNTSIFNGTIAAAAASIKIDLIEIETYNFNTRWFNNTRTITDSGNRATGHIYYNVSTGANGGSPVGNTGFSQYSGATTTPAITNPGLVSVALTTPYMVPYVYISANRSTSTAMQLIKRDGTGSSYKNVGVNDANIYNTNGSGNLSLLNDYTSGNINFAAGGASAAQMTLSSSGVLTIAASSGNTAATFAGASGATVVNINAGSNLNTNLVYQNNAASAWYTGNVGTAAANYYRITNSDANGNSERFKLTQAGILTLNAYGSGAATFDASGNISSVSDERLKNIKGFYKTGLKDLMNIKPIIYKWNKLSGNETDSTYAGFSAQNVKANIPYGTGQNDKGYLSLQDRAIMATLVNAVKEQQQQIEDLKKEMELLKK